MWTQGWRTSRASNDDAGDSEKEKQRLHEGYPEEDKAEESVTSPATMDVFEVLVPSELNHVEDEVDNHQKKEEEASKAMIEKTEVDEDNEAVAAKEEEEEKKLRVDIFNAKLLEKEKQVAILLEENVIFKTRAEEEAKQIAKAARAKEEDIITKLNSMEEELKQSRVREEWLQAQLQAVDVTKTSLEIEMAWLRVQTKQWQKVAKEAAAVLAGGDGAGGEMRGRRIVERCRSMDSWGSPLMAGDMEEDGGERRKGAGIWMLGSLSAGDMEEDGGGRRKGAGIWMLGSLWKKNAQVR